MTKDAWNDPGFAADWDDAGNLLTNPDRLRQLSLLADLVVASGATRLLDLGIGSAQVEAAIARRHPGFLDRCHVTGIDASAAMLDLARQRCERDGLSNVDLVRADFTSIASLELEAPPDAIICVQALHEVTDEVKRAVINRARAWLPPGRPFLILDRFAYPAGNWLDDWRATWDWLRADAPADVMEFDEYHRRYSAKTDHVSTVEACQDWLDEAGFESTCPYRCFNRAMIVARAAAR